ncbi:MAG: hypothetical protein LUH15_01575 [Tannerellaceae bacterium]|nr:hypothetical protein [Tannerellaceae bacterium]
MKRFSPLLLFICFISQAQLSSLPLDVQLSGRLFVDGSFFVNSPEPLHSGAHIPDLRLGAKVNIGESWYGRMDIGLDHNQVTLRDVYIQYRQDNNYYRVGHMLSTYSIDQIISTNDFVFNTPANAGRTFYTGRHTGITFTRNIPAWHFSLGAFMGDKLLSSDENQSGVNFSGRAVWRRSPEKSHLFHIGTGAVYRIPDKDLSTGKRPLSLASRGVTGMNIPYLLDMPVEDVKYQLHHNLEGLVFHNKWFVQTEFLQTYIRPKQANYYAWGYYLQAGFLIKGNRYSYDALEAVPMMPEEPRSLLVTCRFNITNLNDTEHGYYGGKQQDFSVGLNYYFNQYISSRLNYNFMHTDQYAALGKTNIHLIQVRLQVKF